MYPLSIKSRYTRIKQIESPPGHWINDKVQSRSTLTQNTVAYIRMSKSRMINKNIISDELVTSQLLMLIIHKHKRNTSDGPIYRGIYSRHNKLYPLFLSDVRVHSRHYNDIIMGAITFQITSLTIVYSTVYSDADQRKHQSSASLAFVWGIHRGPVNSTQKWPVTRKMFPFDDVIMITSVVV